MSNPIIQSPSRASLPSSGSPSTTEEMILSHTGRACCFPNSRASLGVRWVACRIVFRVDPLILISMLRHLQIYVLIALTPAQQPAEFTAPQRVACIYKCPRAAENSDRLRYSRKERVNKVQCYGRRVNEVKKVAGA